jgi:TP901-1 family phage major tail protein
MAFRTVKGDDFALSIDVDGSGTLTLVGCATTSELSMSTEEQEATCKGSGGWSESQPTTKSWEISTDGLYQPDSDVSAIDFWALWDAGTIFDVKMGEAGPENTTYSGKAFITSLSFSGPSKENATYSVTVKGTGPLTKVTEPAAI